ncbi:hypothetical protein [Enhygromyxa salina]|nr:hypothetical protein [Enhygromyxa salina]
MPRLALLAVTLLACTCERKPAPAPQEVAAAELEPPVDLSGPLELHFGWTPRRLAVVEKVHKTKVERDVTSTYTLEITKRGDDLAIAYRDFHFTSFSGLNLDDPKVRAEITEITEIERQIGATQLGFLVSAEGEFQGLLDIDVIPEVNEALLGAKEGAEIRELLANPRARAWVEQSAARPWVTWVQTWLGLDLEPGEVREGDVEFEFGGETLLQHVGIEHLGVDPARPGHVRLRHKTILDDPRYWGSLDGVITDLVGEVEPDKRSKLQQVMREVGAELNFLHIRQYEVSLDPRTMLPAWAKLILRTSIEGSEPGMLEQDIDSLETHEWTFTPVVAETR